MTCLVDGLAADGVPCDDRGFLYGESVFETIAFRDRQAPLWTSHMDRLQRSASALDLECPEPEILLADCLQLLPDETPCILRVTISAGSGGQGYWPPPEPRSRRVVSRRDWPAAIDRQRREGLRLGLASVRLPVGGAFHGIKHGNRLLQIAAARECRAHGYDEAVLLDSRGQVIEAISSNLVLVLGGALYSHPGPAVDGVGLRWLKEQARSAFDWRPVALDQASLPECSEVLVINSVAGVRPVIEVAGRQFSIGPVCRHLQSLWTSRLI